MEYIGRTEADIFVALAFFLGIVGGVYLTYSWMKDKAIQNNCGFYEKTTGDFSWRKVDK